jgi:hypothetical protein
METVTIESHIITRKFKVKYDDGRVYDVKWTNNSNSQDWLVVDADGDEIDNETVLGDDLISLCQDEFDDWHRLCNR